MQKELHKFVTNNVFSEKKEKHNNNKPKYQI